MFCLLVVAHSYNNHLLLCQWIPVPPTFKSYSNEDGQHRPEPARHQTNRWRECSAPLLCHRHLSFPRQTTPRWARHCGQNPSENDGRQAIRLPKREVGQVTWSWAWIRGWKFVWPVPRHCRGNPPSSRKPTDRDCKGWTYNVGGLSLAANPSGSTTTRRSVRVEISCRLRSIGRIQGKNTVVSGPPCSSFS